MYAGTKCKTCAGKNRKLGACGICSEDFSVVQKYNSRWRCMSCMFVALYLVNGQRPGQKHTPTSEELEDLCRRFFALPPQYFAWIEVWILPHDECLLIEIRCILFRVYGCFAGLLPGPAHGTVLNSGRVGYYVREGAQVFAQHILTLHGKGLWPRDGLVVCSGFTEASLEKVKQHLPVTMRSQLYPYAWSFSSNPTREGPPDLDGKACALLDVVNIPQRQNSVNPTSQRAVQFGKLLQSRRVLAFLGFANLLI